MKQTINNGNFPFQVTRTLENVKALRWNALSVADISGRYRDLNKGEPTPTDKDEGFVSFRDVVKPVTRNIENPNEQFGRGTLFESARAQLMQSRGGSEQERIDLNPKYVESIPQGYSLIATGYYYSGGGGTWSYNVSESSLPIFLGQIVQAPVAPYGGSRGMHYRRLVITNLSLTPGRGGGTLKWVQ